MFIYIRLLLLRFKNFGGNLFEKVYVKNKNLLVKKGFNFIFRNVVCFNSAEKKIKTLEITILQN